MKTLLTAAALAAALVAPASATTFPALTTIYVGTGVEDSGGAQHVGTATVFQCSNVGGQTATLRFLVLQLNGTVAGSHTTTLLHGHAHGLSTHLTLYFSETPIAPGTSIDRGTINIELTESGVFCQAFLVDASVNLPNGLPLHLVRVNPHPGTVE